MSTLKQARAESCRWQTLARAAGLAECLADFLTAALEDEDPASKFAGRLRSFRERAETLARDLAPR
jgi:hypothetical protein